MTRKAVIVGAGPTGILASVYLAKMGFEVVVYERSPEPTAQQRRSQHSYPMVLSSRATLGFAEVGAAPACCSHGTAAPCKGHYSNGALRFAARPGGKDPAASPELETWVVDRVGLAADMLVEARRLWPDRIRFVFDAPLLALDLHARRATLEVEGRQVVEEGYELLVGADGVNSAVRAAMEAQLPGFSTRVLYRSTAVYKTFHGLPASGAGDASEATAAAGPGGGGGWELVPGIGAHAPRDHLYWFDARGGPLVTFWLAAPGVVDGLVSKVDSWDAERLAARLAATHAAIPAPLRDAVVARVAGDATPGSAFGRIAAPSALHGPGVVLLGDAGHAVTGHMGQGCNMALESVRVFARCLARAGGQVAAALPAFSAARLPDTAAMQHLELCMAAFVMGSSKGAPPPPPPTTPAPAGSPPAAPEGTTGSLPLAFRAYATALIMSSMLWGAALHKLSPSRFKLPIYLFAALRDGGLPYRGVLRACHAMLAGSVAVGVATVAAGALALTRWRR